MSVRPLILIGVDIRSLHNVGSLFRTCDGFSASLWLTGISPCPTYEADNRLPHVAKKAHEAIHKTALGAEDTVPWRYEKNLESAVFALKKLGYTVVALEQSDESQNLEQLSSVVSQNTPLAIVVGREVEGLTHDEVSLCDAIFEIPMTGKKESFNVAVSAGIALYEARR